MKLIYLVNFPSQKAVKGQPFAGDEKLKDSLKKRGIIGEGEVSVEEKKEENQKISTIEGERDTAVSAKEAAESKVAGLEADVATEKEAKKAAESKVADANRDAEALQNILVKMKEFVDIGKDTNKNSYPVGYEEYLTSLEA